MIHDPDLVSPHVLDGVTVGISVSDSADIARLGLDQRHLDLAVGEVARAVLLAGGSVTYGGRLRPSGFTQQLINEVYRYGASRHCLTLCLAYPDQASMHVGELDTVDRQLGTWGRIITLDQNGNPFEWRRREPREPVEIPEEDKPNAYSALRHHLVQTTQARILVGGKLTDFSGDMPGVIEEAILSVEAGQPLYLAGGFGGATALVARAVGVDGYDWLPSDMPTGHDNATVSDALANLRNSINRTDWQITQDGLTRESRIQLGASHRPGEIASLFALGLATRFGPPNGAGD